MSSYDTPINTENPQVLVVGAFCEKCGELPRNPDYELTVLPVELLQRKDTDLIHNPSGGCGGKVLITTEPYIPPN